MTAPDHLRLVPRFPEPRCCVGCEFRGHCPPDLCIAAAIRAGLAASERHWWPRLQHALDCAAAFAGGLGLAWASVVLLRFWGLL